MVLLWKVSNIKWDTITKRVYFSWSVLPFLSACVTVFSQTATVSFYHFADRNPWHPASGNIFKNHACEVDAWQSSFCCESTFDFSCCSLLQQPWNYFNFWNLELKFELHPFPLFSQETQNECPVMLARTDTVKIYLFILRWV